MEMLFWSRSQGQMTSFRLTAMVVVLMAVLTGVVSAGWLWQVDWEISGGTFVPSNVCELDVVMDIPADGQIQDRSFCKTIPIVCNFDLTVTCTWNSTGEIDGDFSVTVSEPAVSVPGSDSLEVCISLTNASLNNPGLAGQTDVTIGHINFNVAPQPATTAGYLKGYLSDYYMELWGIDEDTMAFYVEVTDQSAIVLPLPEECVLTLSSSAGGRMIQPTEAILYVNKGDKVQLKAEANESFEFVKFTGGVNSSKNPYQMTVNRDASVRAIFRSTSDRLYIDVNIPDGQEENGTSEFPFDSICEAIEVAQDNSTLVIRPGIYKENLELFSQTLTLTGLDVNDINDINDVNDANNWCFPMIQGVDDEPTISLRYCDDPNMLLQGLVICGGDGSLAGGVDCRQSQLTLSNCLITGNRSDRYNGQASAIRAYKSQVNMVNCTVSDNSGCDSGAVLYADSNSLVTVFDSILWCNEPNEIFADETSSVVVEYSDVAGGLPGVGNCSVDPEFVETGFWEHAFNPGMIVSPWHAYATWIPGDYHLQPTSPCIDAGDPNAVCDLEPDPNELGVNMGAYGNTPEATVAPID